jgi:hypothetical protein
MSWCRVTRDTTAIESYEHLSDVKTAIVVKKGTYVQVSKESPEIYLDNDGDGFLSFNPEALEEVVIEPGCFFVEGELPDDQSHLYPNGFTGNPEDWFAEDTVIMFQG